jgi:phosphoribosyl 1,2-cyclic phosphate phosphodiesterase
MSSSDDEVELLFLGSGTSAGVPMIGCTCRVCTSTDPRDSRTRCSVVMSYSSGGQSIRVLVDATPELRLQCVAQNVMSVDAVVFTHAHADHIMGIDDLRRFNAIRKGPLDVWTDAATYETLDRCFGYAFTTQETVLFRPKLVHRLIERPFEIAGMTWTPIPLQHGKAQILGFRVGNLAYCTDTSHVPESSYELLRGLDVLVLDALQPVAHETHLTIAQAIETAHRIGARETWFTHMSHNVMHAEIDAELPPGIRLAYDGLRVRSSR